MSNESLAKTLREIARMMEMVGWHPTYRGHLIEAAARLEDK